MTIHYHGTPITPMAALYQLAGRCFCVSFARPDDVSRVHQIGQSVMLDNGAFSKWKKGAATDWAGYYIWANEWLAYPTTWAVIPDEIDGEAEEQDRLLLEWPFGERGAPVWHMNEPIGRLIRLVDEWPRVCIGSTSIYADVMSPAWNRRMDETWDTISRRRCQLPWIHTLRGMNCSGGRWPFSSVDSTDIARNHNRDRNTPRKMADRWDAMQCGSAWAATAKQTEMAL